MRNLVAILWMLVLLAGPAAAVSHGHELGHTDEGCLACHLQSSPADRVQMPILESRPLSTLEAPLCRLRVVDPHADPLVVAPKNSPPSAA